MESDLVSVVKELLKRKKAILIESLRGKGGSSNPPPIWLQGLSGPKRKEMLRAVDRTLERVDSPDYGYCKACYIRMPWADIARAPERETCSSCLVRMGASKGAKGANRRKVAVRR